jgi:hypothetical protein
VDWKRRTKHEFLAILAVVMLSLWPREKGSPESKPLEAAHSETGG